MLVLVSAEVAVCVFMHVCAYYNTREKSESWSTWTIISEAQWKNKVDEYLLYLEMMMSVMTLTRVDSVKCSGQSLVTGR